MKKSIYIFVMSLVLTLSACGGPGESSAEFDGGYLWTSGDKYMSLKEVKPARTQIAKGGMSISALMNAKKYYYVLDNTPSAVLSSDETQGIFIKGDFSFKNFSLHKLEEKKLAAKEGLFENKGAATKDKPFYFAGEEIEIAKKSDEDANGYFFKLKDELPSGKYVGWVSQSFWIFEVK
jgi:hypothetical protein